MTGGSPRTDGVRTSTRSAPAAQRSARRTTAGECSTPADRARAAPLPGCVSMSAIAWIVFFTSITSSRGRRRSASRHLVCCLEQLVVVDAAMHQADALGLGAVHHLAEHDAGEGGLRADDAAEHPRVPAAGVDADLQEPCVELGPPGGQAHIAAERQVHAGADRCTVDCRQRRQRAAGDAQEALVDGAEALLAGLGQVAQVRTGAERGRRAGDDDRTDTLGRPRSRPSPRRSRPPSVRSACCARPGCSSVSVATALPVPSARSA